MPFDQPSPLPHLSMLEMHIKLLYSTCIYEFRHLPFISCFACFSICMASSLVGASRSILGLLLSEGLLLLTKETIKGSRNDRANGTKEPGHHTYIVVPSTAT